MLGEQLNVGCKYEFDIDDNFFFLFSTYCCSKPQSLYKVRYNINIRTQVLIDVIDIGSSHSPRQRISNFEQNDIVSVFFAFLVTIKNHKYYYVSTILFQNFFHNNKKFISMMHKIIWIFTISKTGFLLRLTQVCWRFIYLLWI